MALRRSLLMAVSAGWVPAQAEPLTRARAAATGAALLTEEDHAAIVKRGGNTKDAAERLADGDGNAYFTFRRIALHQGFIDETSLNVGLYADQVIGADVMVRARCDTAAA